MGCDAEECMVCLSSEGRVLSGDNLPLKYCDCMVRAHVGCWMRALKTMEGRRFCLICDLEHWDRCWHAAQDAAVKKVLLSIIGMYICVYALYIISKSISGKKDE